LTQLESKFSFFFFLSSGNSLEDEQKRERKRREEKKEGNEREDKNERSRNSINLVLLSEKGKLERSIFIIYYGQFFFVWNVMLNPRYCPPE